ncbi:Ribonuclease BN [Georgfuchsia toluolica]|uniref:Ribonuclease BN n=1 Tax=Georgfuchsia toluolica TaxID=424218 RepID=A0A916J403_9PROT|nr:YhjD/YihY/BrkB family envelope integrity protein [Georgfuchsia toluolica]CAG4884284.1 Ribonuclease BN [Georgfuchsia toluolica]
MHILSKAALHVLQHPFAFVWQVVKSFGRNQGLLLAGAVAYYALLSLVPLLILAVITLSQFVAPAELLGAMGHYLEWLVPSQSASLLLDVSSFLDKGTGIGAVLLVTMLFFSSLAFSALEQSMAVIFVHRKEVHQRHAFVSAVLPYCFVLALGISLLAVTLVFIALQTLAQEAIHFMGRDWSLSGLSGLMLYLLGLCAETLIFSAIYLAMPVGRTRFSHALIGGITATAIWEMIRHLFIWYLGHLSKVSIVYGSLTTAVIALFSMEIAAMLLLFGAQVIAEYELLGRE